MLNWLNHPLRQFGLAGNADEKLDFTKTTYGVPVQNVVTGKTDSVNIVQLAQTNQNTSTTGKPAFKSGQRYLQFALKYYF